MPYPDDEFELLMKDAEDAAEAESTGLPGRIRTAAFFTARKQLRKAPGKIVTAALAHIPVVGAALGTGSALVQDALRKKRVKRKGLLAASQAGYSATSAKDCAKSLSDLAKIIDGNVTKQSKALADLDSAIDRLNALKLSACSYEDFMLKFWDLAYAYYRVDHYNVKLVKLLDDASRLFAPVQRYVDSQYKELQVTDDAMKKNFIAMCDAFQGDDAPLLGLRRQGSSSSFS